LKRAARTACTVGGRRPKSDAIRLAAIRRNPRAMRRHGVPPRSSASRPPPKSEMIMTSRFPPLTREPVLIQALPPANPPVRLVKGARIRFAPGQPTGLHRHPMSTVGVVTVGSFAFQPEGEETQVLRAGDGFFEPAGRTILRFDNASPTEPAEIVCYYLTDGEDRPPIEMLDGGMEAQLGKR
jgi:quercetin dioxygenase-like cupin family protein